MSMMFLLNHNEKLFTIQTLGHAVVIGSKDLNKLQEFKQSLQLHFTNTKKMPNKCRWYSTDRLHIYSDTKYNTMSQNKLHANDISVSYIDIRDDDGVDLISRLYKYNNIKLFLLDDFTWSDGDSNMSLDGNTLEWYPDFSLSLTNEIRIAYLENIIDNM